MDAFVKIVVKVPDLEIIGVDGEVSRSLWSEEINVSEVLQRIIGTRVGPGIKKIIKGLRAHLKVKNVWRFWWRSAVTVSSFHSPRMCCSMPLRISRKRRHISPMWSGIIPGCTIAALPSHRAVHWLKALNRNKTTQQP